MARTISGKKEKKKRLWLVVGGVNHGEPSCPAFIHRLVPRIDSGPDPIATRADAISPARAQLHRGFIHG
jgi:hypothetical protein